MLHPYPLMFGRSPPTITTEIGPPRVFGVPQYLPRMYSPASDPMHHPLRVFHEGPPMFGQMALTSPDHLGEHIPDHSDRNIDTCHDKDDFKYNIKLKSPDRHFPKYPSFNLTNRKCPSFGMQTPDCIAQSRERRSVTPTLNDTIKKTFLCPQCKYTTDRKNNLKRHIITMHFDCDRKLECCGSSFRSKAKLREHVTLFHKNGYRCSTCGRVFCRKALLRRHMTVHSGKKDYHCNACSYATSHKSNLERHQKVHNKFATTPGMYMSRKFHIKSTSKMRKTYFEQYRHNLYNRQYFQEIKRKRVEQHRSGAQEDERRINTIGAQTDEYKTERTQYLAMNNNKNEVRREQSFSNDDKINDFGKMFEKRADGHQLPGDSARKVELSVVSEEMINNSALMRCCPSEGFEQYFETSQYNSDTGLQELHSLSETQAQGEQSNKMTPREVNSKQIKTEDTDLNCTNDSNDPSIKGTGISRHYSKDKADQSDVDNFGRKQIIKKCKTKVPKIRRRLCDKPYRCSNCCSRFEHQVTSVTHVCSQRDARVFLQSISLVTRINKNWIAHNSRWLVS